MKTNKNEYSKENYEKAIQLREKHKNYHKEIDLIEKIISFEFFNVANKFIKEYKEHHKSKVG